MTRHMTRKFVEKLQAVRDGYGEENPDHEQLNLMVRDALNHLLAVSKDGTPTHRWAKQQIENEEMSSRLRRAESLVPRGILDGDDNFYDPVLPAERRRSVNPNLTGLYQWNPDIAVHPYSHNFETPPSVLMNPFNNRPQVSEFVPGQLGRGKTRRHHNKKGKKSIRRRKH